MQYCINANQHQSYSCRTIVNAASDTAHTAQTTSKNALPPLHFGLNSPKELHHVVFTDFNRDACQPLLRTALQFARFKK